MNQPTGADDPMLGSLLLLSRALHRPVPSAVLLEGLPPEGQGMTLPRLFAAAARAGLSTRLVERDLDDIPDTSLPAILLLHKSNPCVLLQRCEHGRFLVALPGWGGGEQEVSREELLAQYSGHAVFAQPALPVEVSADTEPAQPCQSPVAAIGPSWWLHWERLVASTLRVMCLRSRQPTEDVARVGG
ncbi:cysteine peptidase family C39 domain-containing protein [Cupriavidus necator]|uniref:cysteine peptidase family C39 domain-containing protein n=1 Tax=Cupriavidus necator TaxID=106590 RepID=UPI0039C336B1